MKSRNGLRLVQGLLFAGVFVSVVLLAGTANGAPLEDVSGAWAVAFTCAAFLLLGVLAAVSVRGRHLVKEPDARQ